MVYGAIELFIDPGNELLMRIYVIGGIIFSVYVTAATYKCAANCKSPAVARLARISAIITLLLLPVLTYLDLSGALSLMALGGEQLSLLHMRRACSATISMICGPCRMGTGGVTWRVN